MGKTDTHYKIGLLGPFGWGNLGDAAVQDAVSDHIRRLYPNAQIYGFSLNPKDTEERHGFPSFPLYRWYEDYRRQEESTAWESHRDATEQAVGTRPGIKQLLKSNPVTRPLFRILRAVWGIVREGWGEIRFIRQSYRAVKKLDLLVMSGGGQVDELWGGPWRQPYTLLKFSLMARLANAGPIFFNVGVGKNLSFMTRVFVRTSMRLASYRSFRDAQSRDNILAVGYKGGTLEVYPDPVFSLDLSPYNLSRNDADDSLIGINPMVCYDPRAWPIKDQEKYDRYIDNMAQLCVTLLDRGHPTETRIDLPSIVDLRRAMERHGVALNDPRVTDHAVKTVEDLLRCINECSLVVASRFHGVLIAQKLARPVVAISYSIKVDSLMRMQALDDYLLHIDTFDVAGLLATVERLKTESEKVSEAMRLNALAYGRRLEEQYPVAFQAGGLQIPSPEVQPV